MSEFNLEMQDPPRMHERLDDSCDLIGETVLAVFEDSDLSRDVGMVIVTENRNWLVLNATQDGCGEDPYLEVSRSIFYGKTETLADFVKAKPLFDKGCINHAVYAELKAKEDAAETEAKLRRANYLRRQLADVEAGK